LYHADCLTVLPSLPADSIHCVITDPPYGINYVDRQGRSLKGDQNVIVGQVAVRICQYPFDCPMVFFASPFKPWLGEFESLLVWDKGPAVGGFRIKAYL